MIRREKVLEDGRWTYKLTPMRMPVQIKSIEAVPCTTCPYEAKCSLTGVVSPLSCPWISEWVVKEYRENMSMAPQVPQAMRQQIQHETSCYSNCAMIVTIFSSDYLPDS